MDKHFSYIFLIKNDMKQKVMTRWSPESREAPDKVILIIVIHNILLLLLFSFCEELITYALSLH
jgi:hypothetical protein